MNVQILVDNRVVATQAVSDALPAGKPSLRDAKQMALKAALETRSIKLSDALRATFRAFDLAGRPIDDDGR